MAVTYSLYSVRDRKSNFWDPVPMISDGSAIRAFRELLEGVKNTNSDEVTVPYIDLELYRLGSFDLVSGVIAPEMPILIATASIIDDGGLACEK